MRILYILVFGLALITCASPVWAGNPQVVLTTTHGEIVLELDPERAPVTVQNFLTYVQEGFYSGTIFHRVIPGFMIQGGGMDKTMAPKACHAPIQNEANNGLHNTKYTVAMARTADIHSATAQFFINTADNAFLDHGQRDYGYAVFGRVISGQDVVDAISQVPTGNRLGHQNVPLQAVVIEKAEQRP
ncbi:peptidylprolyl isomerase A [Desulfovibrionales bacterium]